MTSARSSAVSCLTDIFDKGAKPRQAIDTVAPGFSDRDRAFLREIVYGTTRYRDALDWVLDSFLKNPAGLAAFTRNNLRAALYQIFFMRVPDWAAVNEAVETEKKMRQGRAMPSLVNGVLRNFIRQRDRFTYPFDIRDPLLRIAVNSSHPQWLVRRWISRFGVAEASALAAANNALAPLTIRTNTLRIDREKLLGRLSAHGIAGRPTAFSPSGITLDEVRSYEGLSFIRGLFSVQDEASQLISLLLEPASGERVLDACAAPGGKTTHMAQLMGNSGEIVAVEADEQRIARLSGNIQTLGISTVKVLRGDITELQGLGLFDRILVDAPCSATGTIRRNPDVKYRRGEQDLGMFRSRQTAILKAAGRLLRPGGTMVYSVCSTEPEEGEEVVEGFLKTEGEFRIIDAEPLLLKDLIDNCFFRTYPHRHAMDGFFGVRICKNR